MWLILGIGAIIFAFLNLIYGLTERQHKWFGFISMSLTALTVCAFYSDGAGRVIRQDFAGLMDVMPTMSRMLWICVVISIVINGFPLFINRKIK